MTRLWVWFTALLLVVLSGFAFLEELLTDESGQGLVVPALFTVLSLVTAVGLVCRIQIARFVASVLYLLTALGGAFQLVSLGVVIFQSEPFNWGLLTRFVLTGVFLAFIVASLWWLTSGPAVNAFRSRVQA